MIKRHLTVFLTVFFFALITNAQTLIAEFETRANNLDDIEAFQVGDSILLSYTDRHPAGELRHKKAFWIAPDKTVSEVSIGRLTGQSLTAVTKHGDKIYYYYLIKAATGFDLRLLQQDPGTTTPQGSTFNLNISDVLLALQAKENTLFLLTYNKDTNHLKVRKLSGDKISYEKEFLLPIELKRHLKSSTGLILNPEITGFEQGSARVKFYAEPEEIIVTIDEPFVRKASKTTIIELKLSGEQTASSVEGPDDEEFSSFYYQGNLYRNLRGNNTLALNIYDIASGGLLYSKVIKKDKALREQPVFQRVGQIRKVWYITMHDMFGKDPEPAILVLPGPEPGEVRVLFGNTFDERGTEFPAGVSILL